MFGLGATELIIILLIVLVLFGAGKLPRVMSDFGKGIKSFKEGMNGNEPAEDDIEDKPTKKTSKKK